jgi:hypothetical protein
MLTIENINKIVGERIVNEWYIKSMHPIVNIIVANVNHKYCYKIIIHNKITNSEGKIYLDRNYKNKEIKHWYELSCMRSGKKNSHLIRKNTISDIKELLEHIKEIADINYIKKGAGGNPTSLLKFF